MKIGLVGFAGSGKTTVFNTMTGQDVPVGYGGEVRLGMVWRDFQRTLETGDRHIKLSLLFEGDAQVIVPIGVVWLNRQRFLKTPYGFI